MKECRNYDLFVKENTKLTLTGPVAGMNWIVKLDAGEKRLYMDNIDMPADSVLDIVKKTAYDMAIAFMENKAAKVKEELTQAENLLQDLTEGKI